MAFHRDDALIVIDLQRDFCFGGALAVPGADDIVPLVNRLIAEASEAGALIVVTRDWHPQAHVSFRSQGGPWPEHCVQGEVGAEFHEKLRLPPDALIVSKGSDSDKDQYSAFEGTNLIDELRRRHIRRVVICGLALDVCVCASALDAIRAGLDVHVLLDATRPISEASKRNAVDSMIRAGVVVKRS
jgi:nicotinamidase/pyrazinamidase